MFVVNASKSSSGKGFLVTVMVETTGAYFRSWVNVEEEIRKALTACLMESDPVVVFDDVGKKDTVSSATLASMLTKKQWDDRILGVSKNFRGENNRTWCLTGNNVKLGGDIPSRSVLIHLDPGPGDPKDRDPAKFALGDIGPWLARRRTRSRSSGRCSSSSPTGLPTGASEARSTTGSASGQLWSAGCWSTTRSTASWPTRPRSSSTCTTTSTWAISSPSGSSSTRTLRRA